jgi:hypothetical protein
VRDARLEAKCYDGSRKRISIGIWTSALDIILNALSCGAVAGKKTRERCMNSPMHLPISHAFILKPLMAHLLAGEEDKHAGATRMEEV